MKASRKKSLTYDFLNLSGMILMGLVVAIIVYPFLHEGGHSLAALLVCADVVKFQILPLPYVMCNVASLTSIQQIVIGVSGMIIPFLIALLIPRKWFWSWYIRFLLFGISLFAFVISAATLILPNGADLNPQDDMLRVLSLWSGAETIMTISLIAISVLIVALIWWDKPVKMICRKFGI